MYDLRTQTVYKSDYYIQEYVGSRNIPVQTFISVNEINMYVILLNSTHAMLQTL